MTGTAMTEASEFWKIYKLDVIAIPTNRRCSGTSIPTSSIAPSSEKFIAIADEIERLNRYDALLLKNGDELRRHDRSRRPTTRVDVRAARRPQAARRRRQATRSTRSSARAGRSWSARCRSRRASGSRSLLDKRGVKHEVLNAKHHKREAEIVAQAGRLGAVTIATNMAGRGTDIILGGNPETMAWAMLQDKYPTRLDVPHGRVGRSSSREIESREKMKARGRRWSRSSAACTSSAPSGTRPAASTCSFAAAAVARAIPAAAASSCRSKTT